MRWPAPAALLLAALTALPCRGIVANTTSVLNKTDTQEKLPSTQPMINKIYQDLYEHTLDLSNKYVKPEGSAKRNSNEKFQNETDYTKKENDVGIMMNVKAKKSGLEVAAETTIDSTVMDPIEVRSVITLPPLVVTRKRKPGESGSSAPLLNYIFDSYSNTHQHRNEKSHNNSIYAAAAPRINALVGSSAHLDCKVDALHDKLVSWVRRKGSEDAMELLTTGTQKYTADERYSARFIVPDIWRLEIQNVRPSDAAHYDCQLSAHPPRTARLTLTVPEVSVRIIDGAGGAVSEQVCEEGSTVALRCEVRGLRMEGGPALLWFRKKDLLNDDTTRGGISVKTDLGSNGAFSMLRVARVRADDAGSYSCAVSHTPPVNLPPAHVILHVIKGESLAELQSCGTKTSFYPNALFFFTIAFIVILYVK